MFGGGGVMAFWWLLPLAFLIALVVYLANPSAGKSATEKSALDILKERYARGEIGKDEFDVKKRDLSS